MSLEELLASAGMGGVIERFEMLTIESNDSSIHAMYTLEPEIDKDTLTFAQETK